MSFYTYLAFAFIGIGISYFFKINKNIKIIICIVIPFLLMFFVAGFRGLSVGADNYSYAIKFLNINVNTVINNQDNIFIYDLYNLLIKGVYKNVYFFNVCNCIIILSSVFWLIRKYSYNYTASFIYFLLLGFFLNSMNQTRQYLAMALLILAFCAAMENQTKKVICIGVAAIFIHNITTVFSFVLILLSISKRINLKRTLWTVIIVLCAPFFLDFLIQIFILIFPRYNIYLNDWVGLYSGLFNTSRVLNLLFYVAVEIIYFLLAFRYEKKLETNHLYLGNRLALFNACAIVSAYLVLKIELFIRIELLFSLYLIIFIPYIIEIFFKQKKEVYFFSYLLLFFYFIKLLLSDGSGVIPYYNILIN